MSREDVGTAATEPPPQMTAEDAIAEIAIIMMATLSLNAIDRSPQSIVQHVREAVREAERVHARNRVVEERAQRAIELLGGKVMR